MKIVWYSLAGLTAVVGVQNVITKLPEHNGGPGFLLGYLLATFTIPALFFYLGYKKKS